MRARVRACARVSVCVHVCVLAYRWIDSHCIFYSRLGAVRSHLLLDERSMGRSRSSAATTCSCNHGAFAATCNSVAMQMPRRPSGIGVQHSQCSAQRAPCRMGTTAGITPAGAEADGRSDLAQARTNKHAQTNTHKQTHKEPDRRSARHVFASWQCCTAGGTAVAACCHRARRHVAAGALWVSTDSGGRLRRTVCAQTFRRIAGSLAARWCAPIAARCTLRGCMLHRDEHGSWGNNERQLCPARCTMRNVCRMVQAARGCM